MLIFMLLLFKHILELNAAESLEGSSPYKHSLVSVLSPMGCGGFCFFFLIEL